MMWGEDTWDPSLDSPCWRRSMGRRQAKLFHGGRRHSDPLGALRPLSLECAPSLRKRKAAVAALVGGGLPSCSMPYKLAERMGDKTSSVRKWMERM